MLARNIYRTLYLLVGIVGLLIQMGIFQGQFYVSSLVYYTVLSNILCMVYFGLRMMYDNSRSDRHSTFRRFIMSIQTKYCVTMCITLTFLVYHFLLAPSGGDTVRTLSPFVVSNAILHYIIPIMTLIDFLVFDRQHSRLRWYDPFVWLIIPAVYLVFILVRAPIFGNIGQTSSPYPYPFMDFTIQPAGDVLTNILVIVVIFVIMGYVLLFFNNLSRHIHHLLLYK